MIREMFERNKSKELTTATTTSTSNWEVSKRHGVKFYGRHYKFQSFGFAITSQTELCEHVHAHAHQIRQTLLTQQMSERKSIENCVSTVNS